MQDKTKISKRAEEGAYLGEEGVDRGAKRGNGGGVAGSGSFA